MVVEKKPEAVKVEGEVQSAVKEVINEEVLEERKAVGVKNPFFGSTVLNSDGIPMKTARDEKTGAPAAYENQIKLYNHKPSVKNGKIDYGLNSVKEQSSGNSAVFYDINMGEGAMNNRNIETADHVYVFETADGHTVLDNSAVRANTSKKGLMTNIPFKTANMTDATFEENKKVIDSVIGEMENRSKATNNMKFLLPVEGFGTRSSDLANNAPQTMVYLIEELQRRLRLSGNDTAILNMKWAVVQHYKGVSVIKPEEAENVEDKRERFNKDRRAVKDKKC